MTGHNVEEVFSLAAKEMYVQACIKQEEERDNETPDDTPGDKKQKDKKTAGTVQLKADKKKSLDQKKKDKGCC